jgi:MFS family permease
VADAPSPYAPGIISDERTPPRPAGRAVVFLLATFAMTVVTTELWKIAGMRGMIMTGHRSTVQSALGLSAMPALLIPLWAYLVDRFPLLGTRREGYVMLSCLLTIPAWLALALGGAEYGTWLAVAVPMGFAGSLSRAVVAGALAEIGHRRAATGRLAAAHAAMLVLATIAVQPVMWVTDLSIAWMAGIAAGLALSVVLLTAILSNDDAPEPAPEPPPETRARRPRFFLSRRFWALVPLLVCGAIATVPQTLLTWRVRATHDTSFGTWQLQQVAAIAAAVGYALLCRRMRVATLMRLVFFVKALVLVAGGRVLLFGETRELDATLVGLAAADGLTAVAVLDLAMRAAPPRREAFGVVLVVSVQSLTALFWNAGVVWRQSTVAGTAWIAAGAAIAAALAVSLVPRSIMEAREGRVVVSPP